MTIFENMFLNFILILFPLFCYIIFLFPNYSLKTSQKYCLFDLTLLGSMFLIYSFRQGYDIVDILSINTLIFISYIKKRPKTGIVLSVLTLCLYYDYLYYLLLLDSLTNILYIIYKKDKVDKMVLMTLLISFEHLLLTIFILFISGMKYSILNFIFLLIFNYLEINTIYYIYEYAESLLSLNATYKSIKKEKNLKLALFKITHEIKNPIAVIKAYLDMLDVNDHNKIVKYIPIIEGEIARLLNLLQDFLLVNKANIAFDLMDINMLLEECLNSQKEIIDSHHIKLIVDLIDDEIFINGDYNRLKQVLINVVKNSIEAMDKKNGVIKVSNTIKKGKLRIEIEDNGMGISKRVMKKIKEPFFTTKNRGTGLGVSLSDEIISAHNGTLKYESKEGIGTKVIINLPLYS